MNHKLQRLVDRWEIRELIEAYVHACDRCDAEALADLYHPDSWDDHGPLKAEGPVFAKEVVNTLLATWANATHLLGQSRIKVDGDSAGAETTFFVSLTRDADGVGMLDLMVGRYVDQIERRGGIWRFKHRKCISEWTSTAPIGEDFMQGSLCLSGLRSADDPSYEALGLQLGRARLTP